MAKPITVKSETTRLNRIYKGLPPNKFAIAKGLIIEAARQRVLCDEAWRDIQENGRVELFSQSPDTDPYERERPAVRQFMNADKNYLAIIKQLDAWTPESKGKSKLAALANE